METTSVLPPPASLSRSPLRNVSGNESLPNSAKRLKRVQTENPVTPSEPQHESSNVELVSIEYPKDVPIPSKGLVKSFFDHAMTNDKSDQSALADAGVLSFEEVLLPAVASAELQALKELQAKVQRDHPHQTDMVVRCRKLVMSSMGAAMNAVAESRAARAVRDAERQEERAQEKEKEAKRQEEETVRMEEVRQREREILRNKQKNELIKKLPKNQELWREIVYLMTEISKLQKEEKMWKEAAEHLDQQEREIEEMERKQKEERANRTHHASEAQTDAEISGEIEKVNQTLEDISLSCVRIHQALGNVSKIAEESDRVRLQLHKQYRRNHQFEGYQGIKDPKGLIMSLSQSQSLSQSEN